jgi:hypothetical protein
VSEISCGSAYARVLRRCGWPASHSQGLFDLYADQINIVQAAYNGKRVSLLFTRGDGFKQLD